MSKSLVVSGKKYYPSATIAQTFNYTPDYVSKIAREGKVDATRVGRQWFIDEDSVRDFVHQTSISKVERKISLQKERQAERLIHELKKKEHSKKSDAPHLVALTQSFAVIACGIFAGLLGWTAVDSEAGVTEIASGAVNVSEQIFARVVPSVNPLEIISQWSSVATVRSSAQDSEKVQLSGDVVSEPVSNTIEVLEFSDEVEVLFKDDEKGIVRPVFKSGKGTEAYQLLVEPLSNKAKN